MIPVNLRAIYMYLCTNEFSLLHSFDMNSHEPHILSSIWLETESISVVHLYSWIDYLYVCVSLEEFTERWTQSHLCIYSSTCYVKDLRLDFSWLKFMEKWTLMLLFNGSWLHFSCLCDLSFSPSKTTYQKMLYVHRSCHVPSKWPLLLEEW